MAEIRTVTTLRYKRDEIVGSIAKYERLLEQARADLAHIEAAISIFGFMPRAEIATKQPASRQCLGYGPQPPIGCCPNSKASVLI